MWPSISFRDLRYIVLPGFLEVFGQVVAPPGGSIGSKFHHLNAPLTFFCR